MTNFVGACYMKPSFIMGTKNYINLLRHHQNVKIYTKIALSQILLHSVPTGKNFRVARLTWSNPYNTLGLSTCSLDSATTAVYLHNITLSTMTIMFAVVFSQSESSMSIPLVDALTATTHWIHKYRLSSTPHVHERN